MLCGWEGNRRSGVALVMRHRLQWFIHVRANGLSKGDEHPAYTPHGIWHSFTFYDAAQRSRARSQPVAGIGALFILSLSEYYSNIIATFEQRLPIHFLPTIAACKTL